MDYRTWNGKDVYTATVTFTPNGKGYDYLTIFPPEPAKNRPLHNASAKVSTRQGEKEVEVVAVTKGAQNTEKDLEKIQEDSLNKRIEKSNDKYNLQIVEARRLYDDKEITEEDFQKRLTEILQKQSIARLEIMKAELEAQKDNASTKE